MVQGTNKIPGVDSQGTPREEDNLRRAGHGSSKTRTAETTVSEESPGGDTPCASSWVCAYRFSRRCTLPTSTSRLLSHHLHEV